MGYLLKNSNSVLRDEAKLILEKPALTKEDETRLFDLFIQRDDYYRFVSDFKELSVLFGDMSTDSNDVLNWSQFDVFDDESVHEILAAMKNRERDFLENTKMNSKNIGQDKQVSDYLVEDEEGKLKAVDSNVPAVAEDDGENAVVARKGRKGVEDLFSVKLDEMRKPNKNKQSKFNHAQLTDSDGRFWSGVVLDTDMTQKTMPGNRVSSSRCLVMIGNLRGAGGFGIGKGPTADKALEDAFR